MPELIELLDDEETEVAQRSFVSFSDHVSFIYRTPPFEENPKEIYAAPV
jgi:hypothetical protein